MELSEVKRRVERMRGLRDSSKTHNTSSTSTSKWSLPTSKDTSMAITEDDVLRSIKTLAPLGSGFQVLQIGDKKMVSSVPRELNRDQSVILGLVQVHKRAVRPFFSLLDPRDTACLSIYLSIWLLIENQRACERGRGSRTPRLGIWPY